MDTFTAFLVGVLVGTYMIVWLQGPPDNQQKE